MFREYLEEQKKISKDFLWYSDNWSNIGQCIFNQGGIIAIKGLLKLHEMLVNEYGIKSFPTSAITSDRAEVLFREIELLQGSNIYPSSLVFSP